MSGRLVSSGLAPEAPSAASAPNAIGPRVRLLTDAFFLIGIVWVSLLGWTLIFAGPPSSFALWPALGFVALASITTGFATICAARWWSDFLFDYGRQLPEARA